MTFDFELSDEPLDGGSHLIATRGEVDLFTAPELKARIGELVEGGALRLVLDLTETTFIDSTTLGVLIGAVKRLRPRGGRLVIVNTDAGIGRTFAITGLDQIFTIVEDRASALEALEQEPESA